MSLLRSATLSLWLALPVLVAGCSSEPPIKIGVLLPLTGTNALESEKSLDWAVEEINKLGIRGRQVELDWEDLGKIPDGPDALAQRAAAARRFLDDPEISAVIGTDYDDTTFLAAPEFIKAKKLLVSPSATTAEITRAFGGKKYIWRTLESDVAQAEMMILYGKNTGAKRVALLATADLYGETFFDWMPFYAEELGVDLARVIRMNRTDPDCSLAMEKIAKVKPDLIYLITGNYDLAYCMVDRARALAPQARLMFSDGGQISGLYEALGARGEGVEGVSIEAYRDPSEKAYEYDSEFDTAYLERYGVYPAPYAANAFDSVAVVAYALARADGQQGEALADAFKEVVDSDGEAAEQTSWSGEGIRHALRLIEQGKLPNVNGATGELRFDATLGTDLTATTYAVWQIKDGIQQWDEVQAGSYSLPYPANYFTKDERRSKFDTAANEALQSAQGGPVDSSQLLPRKGVWAFVAAFSRGWDNYRHQADALATYQLLRAHGVPDDRIILMLADDLAQDPRNPEPGVVRNVPGGPNLNTNLQIDYKLDGSTTAAQVLRILLGVKTSATPQVIESSASDDVLVFWVGHGGENGVLVGGDTAEAWRSSTGSFIRPESLSVTINGMFEAARYRRMLVLLEACHGGVMGEPLQAPHSLLITGASPRENSFGANFDVQSSTWLADAFAWTVASDLVEASGSVTDMYRNSFLKVRGSHVKMYNAERFGPSSVQASDFVAP